jgi:predicted phosphodiesterase
MSLTDRLLEFDAADEPDRGQARTEWDGQQGYIQTAGYTPSDSDRPTPQTFDQLLVKFGFDPADVEIAGAPRVSRWQQRARVRGTNTYETVWLEAYRFHIRQRGGGIPRDLLALIKNAKVKRTDTAGPHWLVFQAGDMQLGKRSREGSTEEILTRYFESLDRAASEVKQCKRFGIEGIQISMPGDCLEGNQSQNGKNLWLTELTITEQKRMLRRLMFETVKVFAPLAGRVTLDVVNGNHDEAQRSQNTYPGDGWATEAAIAVADQLTMNEKSFGHVEVRVPDKWCGSMTVPVGDTIVTVVHGHQWRRDGAMRWWSEQAINNQPAAAAQVLQHGHWHEFMVRSNEHRMVVCSPTFDCGSDWFREKHGATARRGGLLYLLRGGELSRLTIV